MIRLLSVVVILATAVKAATVQPSNGTYKSPTNKTTTTTTTTTTEPTVWIVSEAPVRFENKVYNDKICKNEPTCEMSKLAPEEMQQMGVRNCMCDEACKKYGDCCLDSPYYNETEQRANHHSFYCSPAEFIYMQTKCPASYNVAAIKQKCEISTQPLQTGELKLVIPVTNTKSRLTYGNEYCAQCHGDYSYQAWKYTHYCSEDAFVNTYSPVNNNTNFPNSDTNTTRDYFWESTEAAKHVTFDPKTKTFRSTFNNRSYTCPFVRHLPEQFRPHVRLCTPSISECSQTSQKKLVERCLSYTQIVYYKQQVYKNKDCAVCNGNMTTAASQSFSGCKPPDVQYGASSLFTSSNKVTGNSAVCGTKLGDKHCK